MVISRPKLKGISQIFTKAMDESIRVFGRTLTLKVNTEVFDDYGQVSSYTYVYYTFRGVVTFATKLDQKFMEAGKIQIGDAMLKVSPNTFYKNSNGDIIADIEPAIEDEIMEGDANVAGTYRTWIIRSQPSGPNQEGMVTGMVFALEKRENTIIK